MRDKNKQIWKVLFFSLLTVNLAMGIWLFIMVGIPLDEPFPEKEEMENEETSIFVKSDKRTLNRLIEDSIEENRKRGSFDYQIYLDDFVEFYADIPIFDSTVPLQMTFSAQPDQNGNLILQQEKMELGRMNLPVSYILNFVKKQDNLPEWLIINPKKEQIYIPLDRIVTYENMKVRVKEFDLENDKIEVYLLLPPE
ncbi:MAG: YpmS family protein [Bacillus sp. (in: firmicutes)]